jgi:pyridoxamine 5'-phosphate oxidase
MWIRRRRGASTAEEDALALMLGLKQYPRVVRRAGGRGSTPMAEGPKKQSPDFSRPMAVLKACHERIRSECERLRELVEHVRRYGCDDQARQTATSVIRYFDNAARMHHEDEEADLLPRMMAAAAMSHGSSLTRMVADIATEHRDMARSWTELRAALQEVFANQPLDHLQVDRFIKLYRAHIAIEESNVYPLAEMLLSSQDFEDIGSNMAQRRGSASA